MPLKWRANRSTNGKGQRGTCDEHAWLPRDVSAALPDLACWVCERCGALHLDIPDPSTPGSDPPPCQWAASSHPRLESWGKSTPLENAATGDGAPAGKSPGPRGRLASSRRLPRHRPTGAGLPTYRCEMLIGALT